MPIAVLCGSCQAKLNAPDAAAGKRVKCPKCGTVLQIPTPKPEPDFEVVDDEPKPVVLEDDEDDRPAPKKKPKPVVLDDEDEDEAPRPKKKGKGGKQPAAKSKLPLFLGIGAGVLAVVGVVVWLAFFNGKGDDTANKPDPNPQQPDKPGPDKPGPDKPGPDKRGPDKPGPDKPVDPTPNPNPNPPKTNPETPDPLAGALRLQPSGKFSTGEKVSPLNIIARAGISGDGQYYAVNAKGGHLLDLSGTPKRTLRTETLLQVLANGTAIQYGLEPKLLDVTTNRVLGPMPITGAQAAYGTSGVLCARSGEDFSKPDGGGFGFVTVWDAVQQKATLDLKVPDSRFRESIVTDGGKRLWLFMTVNKYEVECWNVPEKKLERTVKPEPPAGGRYADAGYDQSVSADGAVIVAGHGPKKDGRYSFHEVATGRRLAGLPAGLTGSAWGFMPFGQVYLARTAGAAPVLYDFKAQKVIGVLTGHASAKGSLHVVASADGKRAVSVAEDGEVLVYDLSSLKLK